MLRSLQLFQRYWDGMGGVSFDFEDNEQKACENGALTDQSWKETTVSQISDVLTSLVIIYFMMRIKFT